MDVGVVAPGILYPPFRVGLVGLRVSEIDPVFRPEIVLDPGHPGVEIRIGKIEHGKSVVMEIDGDTPLLFRQAHLVDRPREKRRLDQGKARQGVVQGIDLKTGWRDGSIIFSGDPEQSRKPCARRGRGPLAPVPRT